MDSCAGVWLVQAATHCVVEAASLGPAGAPRRGPYPGRWLPAATRGAPVNPEAEQ